MKATGWHHIMVDHFEPTNDELLLMFFGQTILELEELILHGRHKCIGTFASPCLRKLFSKLNSLSIKVLNPEKLRMALTLLNSE